MGDAIDCRDVITLLDLIPNLSSLDIELHYKVTIDFDKYWPCMRRPRGPRRLKSLRLEEVRLALSGGISTIASIVELEELEELQLINCYDYDRLLGEMKDLPLKLKTFCIHEDEELNEIFYTGENDFLRSLNSLASISLTLGSEFDDPATLLDWSALQASALALKYLRVEYTWPQLTFQRCQSGFAQFCKTSVNLELLAISGVSIGLGEDDIVYFLTCITALRSLKVLELTVVLQGLDDVQCHQHQACLTPEVARACKRECLIQSTVDEIFSSLAATCSKLMVVHLKVDNRTLWRYEDDGSHHFVRSRQIDSAWSDDHR